MFTIILLKDGKRFKIGKTDNPETIENKVIVGLVIYVYKEISK